MNTPLASRALHTDAAYVPSQGLYVHTETDDVTGLVCAPVGAVRGNLAEGEQHAHLSLENSKKLSVHLALETQLPVRAHCNSSFPYYIFVVTGHGCSCAGAFARLSLLSEVNAKAPGPRVLLFWSQTQRCVTLSLQPLKLHSWTGVFSAFRVHLFARPAVTSPKRKNKDVFMALYEGPSNGGPPPT